MFVGLDLLMKNLMVIKILMGIKIMITMRVKMVTRVVVLKLLVVMIMVVVVMVMIMVTVMVVVDLNPPQSVATTDKCKGGDGGRGASENEIDIHHNQGHHIRASPAG